MTNSFPAEIQDRLVLDLQPRPIPPMGEWAEQNIVIPDGPYKGEPFRRESQPFCRLFFQEVDSGRWERIAATGPTQTGKSLICYVIPIVYHLFAIQETAVAGIPSLDMVADKWSEDLLPVIEASPALRCLLPQKGEGGRGGRVKSRIRFRNGSTLRFMTGGGNDKSRAGFTARVLAITEVDGLDEAAGTSRETDKVGQMEGRLRAYLKAGTRTYLECTVSTKTGRIWQEYTGGTQSRIVRPCPYCHAWVTPEREHLVGWQAAENELQAREGASWSCPECSALWSEEDRYQANLKSVLLHHGQEISPDGEAVGAVPQTRTLGFRWTAVDNHFATAGDVAADEWNARRSPDRDNAEKKLCQFVHCVPWQEPEVELSPLNPDEVVKRLDKFKKGIVPPEAIAISVGVDTGKRELHWVAIAWATDGRGYVVEYGMQSVQAAALGVERGLLKALKELKDYLDRGWQCPDGRIRKLDQCWIDSGWHEHTDAVYAFCRDANQGLPPGGERFRASKGQGEGQRFVGRYLSPKKLSSEVRYIGKEYHLSKIKRAGQLIALVNSDHWKSELHQRLSMPVDEPGAIVLYEVADRHEHDAFVDQLTAERQVEKWFDGKGSVVVWERLRRQNHKLDAAYGACAAGHLALSLLSRPVAASVNDWVAARQKA